MRADPAARALAMWRGRPPIRLSAEGRVSGALWLPAGDALFAAAGDWTFLGLEGKFPRFAADVSSLPPEGES